jgi:hypothetical protein
MDGNFQSIGKFFIIAGIVIIAIGILLTFFNKIPFIGKMPGDIIIKRENFTFYFPIVTSIILSIILTLIFYLINKFRQ